MLLPPEFRNCALFTYWRDQRDRLHPNGTAIVLQEPKDGDGSSWVNLLTVRHVIEQVRQRSSDNKLYLRVNNDDGVGSAYVGVSLDSWIFHPQDDPTVTGDDWLTPSDDMRYDVAVAGCPEGITSRSSVLRVDVSSFVDGAWARNHRVDVGDELGIAGLYHQHVDTQRVVPIVRSGMISAMPGEPVATGLGPMDAYLIETRSTGGLSGSPVFWLSGAMRHLGDGKSIEQLSIVSHGLLGLMQGHYDTRIDAEKLNDGIAIVVPARTILDTLGQEAVKEARRGKGSRLRNGESGPSRGQDQTSVPPA